MDRLYPKPNLAKSVLGLFSTTCSGRSWPRNEQGWASLGSPGKLSIYNFIYIFRLPILIFGPLAPVRL